VGGGGGGVGGGGGGVWGGVGCWGARVPKGIVYSCFGLIEEIDFGQFGL